MKIKNLFLAAALMFGTMTHAALQQKEASGWQESAYLEFTGLSSSYSQYNAYISADGGTSWTRLDGMLVRGYGSYGRVDAVGLAAGTYMLKVVPCDQQGAEIAADAVSSGALTVVNYDRSGFAHTGAYATKGVGAYNNDGTLKAGAKVFYVTAATAKTISTNVTGAEANPCVGMQTIINAYQKGKDTTPIDFRIIGKLEASDMDALASSEEGLQIKGRQADSELNITIEGIGNDAMVRFGFLMRNAASVELRNLGIATTLDDDVSLDTDNDHIWIHNLDVFYGPNKGGDQKKGDGAIDVKANSKHVTISYNHFWDTGKSSMCGMTSETGPNYITYHHNWFDHSDSRHARVRTMSVHMYNNYYDGIAKYGVGATMGSSVFMEANYFKNCPKPMLISKQGTDVHMGVGSSDDTKGTFSGEAGGMIKSFGNYYYGSKTLVTYQTNQTHFDCWEATNRNDQVPSTVISLLGSNTYNNFDTNSSIMYSYTPDAAQNVPGIVTGALGAGRVQHGDLQYTFTDADNSNYDVTAALRSAIDSYTSTLVGILGDSTASVTPTPGPGPDPQPTPTGGWELYWDNATGAWSTSNFTIAGSTTKKNQTVTLLDGSSVEVAYGIKMESATAITFTAPSACTLKIQFQSDQTGNIKIDGTKETSTTAILTKAIAAGAHTISKGDSRNVFYIALVGVDDTALDQIDAAEAPVKFIQNGHLYIRRSGHIFDTHGRLLK